MTARNVFEFSRQIRLSPAIGDWTTIQYRDSDLDEINISPVHNINFDSLPKEQMKMVHFMHYRLAEQLTKKMSHDMEIKVELHSIIATQISYEDFINAQQEDIVQTDLVLEDNHRINVLIDWSLADMMVNRLVGGKADAEDRESFNEIESEILKTQMAEIKPFFQNIWKINEINNLEMNVHYGQYRRDKKISLREAYVLFTFYFYFAKDDLRKITIAYPNIIIRDFIRSFMMLPATIKPTINLEKKTKERTIFPLSVDLGNTKLKMSEIQTLQVGDIIPLNSKLDEPLLLTIGNTTKLRCQPGIFSNQIAIQVLVDEELTKAIQRFKEIPHDAENVEEEILSVPEASSVVAAQMLAPEPEESDEMQDDEVDLDINEDEGVEEVAPEEVFLTDDEPVEEEVSDVEPDDDDFEEADDDEDDDLEDDDDDDFDWDDLDDEE